MPFKDAQIPLLILFKFMKMDKPESVTEAFIRIKAALEKFKNSSKGLLQSIIL